MPGARCRGSRCDNSLINEGLSGIPDEVPQSSWDVNQTTIQIFAENLRIECEKSKSIAYVCRSLGINRQQFNKYLKGDHLPSAKRRRMMCEFFGVPEDEMFTPASERVSVAKRAATQQSTFDISIQNLKRLEEAARTFLPRGQPYHGLKDGFYYCYFPMQNNDEFLVRSLVKIKALRGMTAFVRHTFFRSAIFPSKVIARGRHRGFILPSENESYLVGINCAAPHHLSVLTVPRAPDSIDQVFRGLALTRGISGTYSCRHCLEYLGTSLRDVRPKLALAGVVKRTDPSIHPSVAASLSNHFPSMAGQLDLPNVESILFATLSGATPSGPRAKPKRKKTNRPS